jgi:hypothetical protein
MKTINKIAGIILLACLIILGSCRKEEGLSFGGSMRVLLTSDAPLGYKSPYTKINVDVVSVSVGYVEPGIPANHNKMGPIGPNIDFRKWVKLDTKAGVYDLIELQNNITAEIAKGSHLIPGTITQIRIMLGTRNSVRLAEGPNWGMIISPEDREGIFINTDLGVQSGKDLFIVLGINISNSVINNGEEYIFKPAIEVKAKGYGTYPSIPPPVFHGPSTAIPQ